MLLGCLAVAAARATEWWLWEFERFLIGPNPTDSWWLIPLPLLETGNNAVANTLLVCVLAVVVERVMRREFGRAPAHDEPAPGVAADGTAGPVTVGEPVSGTPTPAGNTGPAQRPSADVAAPDLT
jgi:hypothetical protein